MPYRVFVAHEAVRGLNDVRYGEERERELLTKKDFGSRREQSPRET